MLANRTLQAASNTGYQIQRSLRFRGNVSAYLSKTFATGNRRTWTLSCWVKRGSLSSFQTMFSAGTTSPNYAGFRFTDTNALQFFVGGAVSVNCITNAVYRDPSAWYHVVLRFNTTEATASNRIIIYVNGTQSVLGTANYPSQNTDWEVNNTYIHTLAAQWITSATTHFDGYMSEVNFIDGQALDANSFGQTDPVSGVWSAKKYIGTYGNNGFYLDFNDTSSVEALGYDKQTTSRTFSTAGTYSFTVPTYSTSLVVKLWGGGGGGGGGGSTFGNSGTNGTATTFSTLSAGGGGGGTGAWTANPTGSSGAGGTATGGTINTNGNSIATTNGATTGAGAPNGGGNTVTATANAEHYAGTVPGGAGTGGRWEGSGNPTGGAGGSGAYVEKTYNVGDLIPGTVMSITVGAAGSGGSSDADQGANGADGRIMIIVDRVFLTDVSSVAGWTLNTGVGGTPSITLTSGDTRVANGSNNSVGYYKTISTVIGQTYYVEGRIFNVSVGAADRAASIVKADVSAFNVNVVTIGSVLQSSGSGTVRGTFVATATTTYISLAADILTSGSADFEDVTVGTVGFMNNWTPTNISLTAGATYDSMLDVPLGGGGSERGNYCVLNPLISQTSLASGNLYASTTGQSGAAGTIVFPYAKTIFESVFGLPGASNHVGVIQANCTQSQLQTIATADGVLYRSDGGIFRDTGSGYSQIQTVASYTNSEVIGVAVDITVPSVQFYKNGSAVGTPVSLTASVSYLPFVHFGGGTLNANVNFGQRPFTYTPPTGFKALHTGNLPIPAIRKPNQYFDVITYTGDSSSSRSITGLHFAPDFVWSKPRTAGSSSIPHWLYDRVRGTGANSLYSLSTNNSDAEFDSLGGSGNATAFTSDGVTFTSGTSNNFNRNESGVLFVNWNWKAGGTAVTNTAGTITSQVSANTTSGFSIVTFTAHAAGSGTFGHGLGVVPAMVIVKSRSSVTDWFVYHKSLGETKNVRLNLTDPSDIRTGAWNDTAPTSTVVTLGSNWASSVSMVAYVFAEVAGFSKFGSYTGNGSADGPFVYCGFRPRYVMWKRTDTAGNWYMLDAVRGTSQPINATLYPNLSNTEYSASTEFVDFLSNGFKQRNTEPDKNGSGGTYIFIAFAEAPFKYALAR